MLDGIEAVAPAELFLKGFDKALTQPVLLGRVGHDVLLLDAIVPDHGTELAGAKDQLL